MNADQRSLNHLSQQLWTKGIAAFCPTTLSSDARSLRAAVARLGSWIRSGTAPGAVPLGIHLEGPYLHPGACGAHPPRSVRPFDLRELEELWDASQQTLKIITLAPEKLSSRQLRQLGQWRKRTAVVLSLGHSLATEEQAKAAFAQGFSGITHAWNALPFHHRSPGALGAALGKSNIHLELILDQVHVAPTVVNWTLALHPHGTCFVSDCVPAAGTRPGSWHRFGNLRIRSEKGVCTLPNGHLAGGAQLLPLAYSAWLQTESRAGNVSLEKLLRRTVGCLTTHPLQALGISPRRLSHRQVAWKFARGTLLPSPL